jgi:hypothetical protein
MEAPVKKYGIENTKEILDLGFGLGEGLKKSKADGKLDAGDIVHLIPIINKVEPAIDDAGVSVKELMDLDDDEAKELIVYAGSKLTGVLSDEEVLEKIEVCLELGISILKTYKVFVK